MATVLLSLATAAGAQDLSGDKRVTLLGADGERVEIGRVHFEPAGADRWRFRFELTEGRFDEHFLAMRPFRCITGVREQMCHFPWGSEATVTRTDLQPLEYALMFLRMKPGALHVDGRDGVYYRLAFADQGLRGELYDVDVAPIIAPTGDGNPRPLQYRHLDSAQGQARWLPRLTIE